MPGKPYCVVAVGNDRAITSNYRPGVQSLDCNLSQIKILRTGKALVAGMGHNGFPGSVQVWKFPLDNEKERNRPLLKINEVQAHSSEINRIRLSDDNKFLFTVGRDGIICIFDVKADLGRD